MRFCRQVIFQKDRKMKLTILGARGSVPIDRQNNELFGGATSCIMVETEDAVIFLDAGTGILGAPEYKPGRKVSILLSHPHIDHLLGLPFFPYLKQRDLTIDIYATEKGGLDTKGQIDRFISWPLWPCTITDYPAEVVCHTIGSGCEISGVKVDLMESFHPGGSTIFRLEHDNASFVYATDYEHTDEKDAELVRFCRDTDLLLYDGQYTVDEYDEKRGFGHSTAQHALSVMEGSGARLMRIIHHHPTHSDEDLLRMEASVRTDNISFARQGETIWLQR